MLKIITERKCIFVNFKKIFFCENLLTMIVKSIKIEV